MAYETDERLKSFLDTNQLAREQMCLQVLSVDKRFSDVRPRHPRGGKDGGRDLEAKYENTRPTFGAVGFVNQANDSSDQKKQIFAKFDEDLSAALAADPKPQVFVFFTNVTFTIGEKKKLVGKAMKKGLLYCDVFDRERLRIVLDSPDGFYIRFHHLDLPLTPAEQASFFARWGGDLQSVISTGFQSVHRTLERMLFLQESERTLHALHVRLVLDRRYAGDEIGHFRAFCSLKLHEPKHRIWFVLFGSYDRPGHGEEIRSSAEGWGGIKNGIGGRQWEQRLIVRTDGEEGDADTSEYVETSSSTSIGMDVVDAVTLQYTHDPPIVRHEPRIALKDLDDAWLSLSMNESLAKKIERVEFYANGYTLLETEPGKLHIDSHDSDFETPVPFSETELADRWVQLRPASGTFFSVTFFDKTPRREFEYEWMPARALKSAAKVEGHSSSTTGKQQASTRSGRHRRAGTKGRQR